MIINYPVIDIVIEDGEEVQKEYTIPIEVIARLLYRHYGYYKGYSAQFEVSIDLEIITPLPKQIHSYNVESYALDNHAAELIEEFNGN